MPIDSVVLIAVCLAPFLIFTAFKWPLIFPFGLYVLMVPFDPILGEGTSLTRFVAIASGGALVFHMLVTRQVLVPPRSWAAWAPFILLASLTGLWTMDASRTVIAVPQLIGLYIFFTIVAMYPVSRKQVRLIGGMVVTSGFLLSAIGIVGYLQGFRTQSNRFSIGFNGLLLDPNHIAASLLLPIAIAVGGLLSATSFRVRAASGTAAAAMIITLLLTGSRGGLISMSVMMLYLAWKTRYRLQILGVMALGFAYTIVSPTVWERFQDKGLVAGSGRLFIWDAGRLALKDHWLNGAGFGAFEAAYDRSLLLMYQPIFQGWSRPAHDAFLSAAVELGVGGSILLIFAWWSSWRDAAGNPVIEASLLALAVAALFLDMVLFKYLWLALAMAALVANAANPRYLRGGARRLEATSISVPPTPAHSWKTRHVLARNMRRIQMVKRPHRGARVKPALR